MNNLKAVLTTITSAFVEDAIESNLPAIYQHYQSYRPNANE